MKRTMLTAMCMEGMYIGVCVCVSMWGLSVHVEDVEGYGGGDGELLGG